MKSGVLLVNKPSGFTSFDVIAVLRGVLKERRLGHTGTLDPMARGVLPVLVGKAAKAADILPDSSKSYEAEFTLGFATDTQDITGEVIKRSDNISASASDIEAVLKNFTGRILQVPPMYSAVSVNGKRLYELARQGIEVEREAREIEIRKLRLLSYDEAEKSGRLFISCSKGTYIRTLINDIGEKLGTYGCMTSLLRTMSHGFKLESCLDLEDIKNVPDKEALIAPTDSLFRSYERLDLQGAQARMYKNGVKLDPKRVKGADKTGLYRVYADEFLGLAEVGEEEIKVYKSFWG